VRIQAGRPLARFDTPAPGGAAVAVLTDEGWGRIFNRQSGGAELDDRNQRPES
jgi:hypothetical protein